MWLLISAAGCAIPLLSGRAVPLLSGRAVPLLSGRAVPLLSGRFRFAAPVISAGRSSFSFLM